MTLKDAIQGLVEQPLVSVMLATVKSVDETKRLCDVEPLNGDADFLDVKLQANSTVTGVLLLPKIGCLVVIGVYSDVDAVVLLGSEVEKVLCKIGSKEIVLTDKGVTIKSATADYKKEFNSLISEFDTLLDFLLQPSSFVTGAGVPVVVAPQAIATLTQKKVKLNLIKQNIDTIFE